MYIRIHNNILICLYHLYKKKTLLYFNFHFKIAIHQVLFYDFAMLNSLLFKLKQKKVQTKDYI